MITPEDKEILKSFETIIDNIKHYNGICTPNPFHFPSKCLVGNPPRPNKI